MEKQGPQRLPVAGLGPGPEGGREPGPGIQAPNRRDLGNQGKQMCQPFVWGVLCLLPSVMTQWTQPAPGDQGKFSPGFQSERPREGLGLALLMASPGDSTAMGSQYAMGSYKPSPY